MRPVSVVQKLEFAKTRCRSYEQEMIQFASQEERDLEVIRREHSLKRKHFEGRDQAGARLQIQNLNAQELLSVEALKSRNLARRLELRKALAAARQEVEALEGAIAAQLAS